MNKDPYKEKLREENDNNDVLNGLEDDNPDNNLEEESQQENNGELFDPYEELEMEEPKIDPNNPTDQYQKTIKVIDESDRHRPDSSVAQAINQMYRPHNKVQENLNKMENAPDYFQNPELDRLPTFGPYKYPGMISYKGQYFEGQRRGIGTMVKKSGAYYYGQFDQDAMHGKGLMLLEDGSKYEGSFKMGIFYGTGKLFDAQENTLYEGSFIDGVREGFGKKTYSNGTFYEGEFKSNLENGQGVHTYPKLGRIKGTFIDGRLNGKGRWDKQNGAYYEGDLIEKAADEIDAGDDDSEVDINSQRLWIPMKEGKGKEKTVKGAVYEGDFMNDLWHGQGTLQL